MRRASSSSSPWPQPTSSSRPAGTWRGDQLEHAARGRAPPVLLAEVGVVGHRAVEVVQRGAGGQPGLLDGAAGRRSGTARRARPAGGCSARGPRARDRRRAPRGTAPAPPGRSGRARRSSRRAAYSTPRNTLRAHGCPGALGGGAGVPGGRGHRGHPQLAARHDRQARDRARDPRRRQRQRRRDGGRRRGARRCPACACCATRRTSARAGRCGAGCWRREGSCGCTATPTAVRRCDALRADGRAGRALRRRRRLAPGGGRGGRAAPAGAAPDRGAQLRAALPRACCASPRATCSAASSCGARRRPRRPTARRALTGWTFDAETLAMARALGFSITETGIPWTDRAGSRLSMPRVIVPVTRELLEARGRVRRVARGARRRGRPPRRPSRACEGPRPPAGPRRGGRAGRAGRARAGGARRAAAEGVARRRRRHRRRRLPGRRPAAVPRLGAPGRRARADRQPPRPRAGRPRRSCIRGCCSRGSPGGSAPGRRSPTCCGSRSRSACCSAGRSRSCGASWRAATTAASRSCWRCSRARRSPRSSAGAGSGTRATSCRSTSSRASCGPAPTCGATCSPRSPSACSPLGLLAYERGRAGGGARTACAGGRRGPAVRVAAAVAGRDVRARDRRRRARRACGAGGACGGGRARPRAAARGDRRAARLLRAARALRPRRGSSPRASTTCRAGRGGCCWRGWRRSRSPPRSRTACRRATSARSPCASGRSPRCSSTSSRSARSRSMRSRGSRRRSSCSGCWLCARSWASARSRSGRALAAVVLLVVVGTAYRVASLADAVHVGRQPFTLEPGERAALRHLDELAEPGGVLAPVYTGIAVPAYTGRETWIGAGSWTPDQPERARAAEALFGGRLDAAAAEALVRRSRRALRAERLPRPRRHLGAARRVHGAAAALRLRERLGGRGDRRAGPAVPARRLAARVRGARDRRLPLRRDLRRLRARARGALARPAQRRGAALLRDLGLPALPPVGRRAPGRAEAAFAARLRASGACCGSCRRTGSRSSRSRCWSAAADVFDWPSGLVYFGFAQAYDPDTFTGGIGQAWTLSVEVAFYAALPLLALAAYRLGGAERRGVLRGEVAAALRPRRALVRVAARRARGDRCG